MKILPFTLALVLSLCFVNQEQAYSATKRTSQSATKGGSLATCRALVLEKSEFDHKDDALQGISEVCVLMAPFNRPFQPAPTVDANIDDIKKAIEQKCRNNGLRVTDGHNWKTPVLTVELSSLSGPKTGQVAYIMTVELNEISILARDMKTRIFSRLYTCKRLGGTGELHLSQAEIQEGLLDCVDNFILEWRHNNGRR